jgi:hypothetical protein
MKHERTALFIIGSARSDTSRTFVGAMTAAVIERFADAHGPLRALVVGEEWGQLYVSNFHEILTLYRQGVNRHRALTPYRRPKLTPPCDMSSPAKAGAGERSEAA